MAGTLRGRGCKTLNATPHRLPHTMKVLRNTMSFIKSAKTPKAAAAWPRNTSLPGVTPRAARLDARKGVERGRGGRIPRVLGTLVTPPHVTRTGVPGGQGDGGGWGWGWVEAGFVLEELNLEVVDFEWGIP